MYTMTCPPTSRSKHTHTHTHDPVPHSVISRKAEYILGEKVFIHIQGDSGGICTTLGNDSMSDSKQKSS